MKTRLGVLAILLALSITTFAASGNEYVRWSDLPNFMAAFFVAYGLFFGLLAAFASNQMAALVVYLLIGAFIGGIAYILSRIALLLLGKG